MPRVFLTKLKESTFSVLPIAALVLVLSAIPPISLPAAQLIALAISAVALILGMALFSLGAELAMSPMGEYVGAGLSKSRKILLLLGVSFIMGVLITIAEPDLSVLAGQVKSIINSTVLIVTVGVGVGLFLTLAIIKIVYHKDLSALLLFFYLILFALCGLLFQSGKGSLLPLSFDSGGVTTGPITVPFIMALCVGVATTIGGKDSNQNSFGLVALCSIGPMLAVILLSLASKGSVDYVAMIPDSSNIAGNILPTLKDVVLDVLKALGLIVLSFLILQFTLLKLPPKRLKQLGFGIIYTFFGLVIFLTAVNVGFVPVGYALGQAIANYHPAWLVAFGGGFGLLVVLAEPAVHVLNRQVESVTSGAITKRAMLIALSIGVGISIALSMLRMVLRFSILYYLLPGYLLSLGLSFFVPKVYTAIAFDSGGVASGPLTSGFALPLAIGACLAINGQEGVLDYAFGIVAMVAMTPLITIQLLGFRSVLSRVVRKKIALKRITASNDEQIIEFM